jgi:hypothetical protein
MMREPSGEACIFTCMDVYHCVYSHTWMGGSTTFRPYNHTTVYADIILSARSQLSFHNEKSGCMRMPFSLFGYYI